MLAVFNGTSGADTIVLYLAAGGVPHVVINGNDQQVLDPTVVVNALGGDDDVHMNGWAPGTTVDLGAGWNEVYYGGGGRVIFGEPAPATIVGGADTDDIHFFDNNGGTTSRAYNLTPTSVMNQTFTNDVDSIRIETRAGNGASPNTINITGTPSSFLTSMSGVATLNVGSISAPIDIDELNVRFTTNLVGDKNYYNQDANGTNRPWVLEAATNVGGAQIQDLFKGGFRISHYENYDDNGTPVNMFLFGGSTVDQFDVAGLVHASTVNCYGGGGDDICRTTDGAWTGHNDDLDEIFVGASFAYFGGAGLDYLDLNDINDQTGDGDGLYQLDTWRFLKNAVPMVFFDASTERIQVIGDQGANDIYFTTNPNSQVTIGGAGGNDALFAGNFGNLSTYGASATISGGDGTDALIVTTANDNAITQYDFDNGNTFSWNVGATTRAMRYLDGSLEQLRLTGNVNDTPYNLRRIAPTLALTIDANAGDDVFTVGGGDLDSNGFAHVTVSGAGGNDSITYDDSLDAPTPGENETYTWTSVGLSKAPGASIVAGGFETQTLKTGTVNALPSVPNVVNLNSSSVPINITGGGNRPTTINVGQGNLDTIHASLTIAMPSGPGDVLNINDQSNAASNVEYQLRATSFLRSVGVFITHDFSFTGINQRNLNAGNGNNAIAVFASTAGETTTFSGGGGNDTFYVGQGNLDLQLPGDVILVGGAGTDVVRFNNTSDATAETQTLNDGSFTDGATFYWSSVEEVRILAGSGGGTINVTAITTPAVVEGNLGNDTVNIGGGTYDGTVFAPLTFNGGGGGLDRLNIDDRFDAGNDSYDMLAGQFRKFTTVQSPAVSWDNAVEEQTLHANTGNNFIFVGTNIASRMNIFAGAGNDHVYTNGGHDITVDTGAEAPSGSVLGDRLSVNADGTAATVQVRSTDRIADVLVNPGGKLQLMGGTLDVTNAIQFNFGGIIDVAGGAMVVRHAASQTAQYRNWIKSGYANGAWNGTNDSGAINSSWAASTPAVDGVGYAPAGGIFGSFPATFGGVTIDDNCMLLAPALAGDANLDGRVNLDDFNRLAGGFGQTNQPWHQGDFNYDGTVNLSDFNPLAGNFGRSLGAAPDGLPADPGEVARRLLPELA